MDGGGFCFLLRAGGREFKRVKGGTFRHGGYVWVCWRCGPRYELTGSGANRLRLTVMRRRFPDETSTVQGIRGQLTLFLTEVGIPSGLELSASGGDLPVSEEPEVSVGVRYCCLGHL